MVEYQIKQRVIILEQEPCNCGARHQILIANFAMAYQVKVKFAYGDWHPASPEFRSIPFAMGIHLSAYDWQRLFALSCADAERQAADHLLYMLYKHPKNLQQERASSNDKRQLCINF